MALTDEKVADLKRLANCVELIDALGGVGSDVKLKLKNGVAEGLWHVMYDSIHPTKGDAK